MDFTTFCRQQGEPAPRQCYPIRHNLAFISRFQLKDSECLLSPLLALQPHHAKGHESRVNNSSICSSFVFTVGAYL
jgi:hypothetical protein